MVNEIKSRRLKAKKKKQSKTRELCFLGIFVQAQGNIRLCVYYFCEEKYHKITFYGFYQKGHFNP